MPYDAAKIRSLVKQLTGSGDPHEFRPPKAKDGEELNYRFFVLPPLTKGDKCAGGTATGTMDTFFLKNGVHWINQKPYPCPRLISGDDCPLCTTGFDLLRDESDKEVRKKIARTWLSQSLYTVNIYFPNIKTNPEDVRGKVKFFNSQKTIFDTWYACLMREDPGDVVDPKAFGVFFDEYAAYIYQLEISKNGEWNNYKTSKFLASANRMPIVCNEKREPIDQRIHEVLAQRHDLFQKIGKPDLNQLNKLAKHLRHGTPIDDEEQEEVSEEQLEQLAGQVAAEVAPPVSAKPAARQATKPAPTKSAAKPAARPAPPPVVEEVELPVEDVVEDVTADVAAELASAEIDVAAAELATETLTEDVAVEEVADEAIDALITAPAVKAQAAKPAAAKPAPAKSAAAVPAKTTPKPPAGKPAAPAAKPAPAKPAAKPARVAEVAEEIIGNDDGDTTEDVTALLAQLRGAK